MRRSDGILLWALAGAGLMASASCAARQHAPARQRGADAVVGPATRRAEPRVERLGVSHESRPIDLFRFGDAPGPVLIIGGTHGNEPTSAFVAERFARHLRDHPDLWNDAPGARSVAMIPVANPDGCKWGIRSNARGVDVNRNFPAMNWRRRAHRHNNNGAEPLSEPESRAIAEAVERLRPRLIVSIHSIDRGRHCNNFDGPAGGVAELMSRHNGYPVQPSMGYPTPGSLGSWAGVDRQIPVVTLELPRDRSGEQAWAENREALLAAIASDVPDATSPGRGAGPVVDESWE